MDDVVLLDAGGRAIGTAPRRSVHTRDTPLHRAFSLHLLDGAGRTLLTRRALTKTTWPGVWTNSCCGHPQPREDESGAIERRLGEELGVRVRGLRCVLPDFRYRATDASGLVENELCPVWVGRIEGEPCPDPDEVAEWAWIGWDDLVTAVRAAPVVFSPWAVLAVPAMAEAGFRGD
ncbi:isopentenyl-diphosphate Delta-isomerase [Desertihabitans aurantiacus]|uniref:isopentenyl-diphosphate Delta-isomerase n=1 Tax=Desertihabitans aurantiacus TaxID=2282477 RepID=UPI000DF73B4E|nr:isopentenyl-diphosphate Delta-isomerase [Desertihabitans aurantiacus]